MNIRISAIRVLVIICALLSLVNGGEGLELMFFVLGIFWGLDMMFDRAMRPAYYKNRARAKRLRKISRA